MPAVSTARPGAPISTTSPGLALATMAVPKTVEMGLKIIPVTAPPMSPPKAPDIAPRTLS